MSLELKASEDLKLSVSKAIFNHIDGMAIGSTVDALRIRGIFDAFRDTAGPHNIRSISERFLCREGFLNVAFRLLAHQGFVKLSGDMDSGCKEASLTNDGFEWLKLLDYYGQIPALSAGACHFREAFSGKAPTPRHAFLLPEVPNHIVSPLIESRVVGHLYGEITAVIMTELYFTGILQQVLEENKSFLSFNELDQYTNVSEFVAKVFESNGWGKTCSKGISLTDAGILASQWTPQYFYPVCYLPTFRNVPTLLFGKHATLQTDDASIIETHVDRHLDIKFSGIVFERICRQPFLDVVLPLFNRTPLEEQPASIVDTGSGDGTLLVEMFKAIRDHTLRGRFLDAYPLTMVGAEYTQIAGDTTQKALEMAGVSNCKTIFGDIGDPAGLAGNLSNVGVDPGNALHVSKSVIHNRTYRPPRNRDRLAAWTPISQAPFVSPDGNFIRPLDLECNLIELFENWRPLTQKHGMVVIEAHTVDPELVSSKTGQNIMTCIDATHGYSSQYLIEHEAFSRAAESAGYQSVAYRGLSGKIMGKPTLTINHFMPLAP